MINKFNNCQSKEVKARRAGFFAVRFNAVKIILLSVLAAVMIAAAAFSVGVYCNKYGSGVLFAAAAEGDSGTGNEGNGGSEGEEGGSEGEGGGEEGEDPEPPVTDPDDSDEPTVITLSDEKYFNITDAGVLIGLSVDGFSALGVSDVSYTNLAVANGRIAVPFNVVIPDKVVTITNTANTTGAAFTDCHTLQSVTIPEGVTRINNYSFYNCYGLTEINYNATTCADLQGSNHVFYCAGDNADGIKVTIGANVTKVPAYIFYPLANYSPKITSVTFEEDTECDIIGDYAFAELNLVKGFEIPDTVTSIGNYAFYKCSRLVDELSFSENLKSIGNYAFFGCLTVKTIEVLENVTTTGQGAFGGCTALTSITLDYIGQKKVTENDTYQYPFGWVFGTTSNVGSTGSGQSYIGSSLTSYPSSTFYIPNSLTTVVIRDGLVVRGSFQNCRYLTSITIPATVTSFGDYAFSGCTALTDLNIPKDITYLGEYAFNSCSSISGELEFLNITAIKDYTFNACTKLEGVITTPSKITAIGQYAFRNCTSLEEFEMPTSTSFKTINQYTFDGCTALTSITIPVSVTSIGVYAFNNCTKLAEINYNATNVSDYDTSKNLSTNMFNAVGNSNADGTVFNVGANVTRMPAYLLYSGTNKITKVIFAENSKCSYMGSHAFYGCRYVQEMTIPFVGYQNSYNSYYYNFGYIFGHQTNTSNSAYNGTYKVLQYTSGSTRYWYAIPDTLTKVNVLGGSYLTQWAFQNCEYLVSITIPSTVSYIQSYAFQNCRRLQELNYNAASVSNLGANNYIFENIGTTSGSVTVNIGATVRSLPSYLFNPRNSNSYTRITNVVFEEGSACTTIGTYTFAYCNYLKTINLPVEKITSIGTYAFYYCNSLTAIDIPKTSSYTTIGDHTFAYCTALKYLSTTEETTTLPSNITTINTYAFEYCYGFKDFVVPTTVTTIYNFAFAGCYGLNSITLPFIGYQQMASNQAYRRPFGWIFGNTSYSGCWGIDQTYYESGNTTTRFYIPAYIRTVNLVYPESTDAKYDNLYYGAFQNCSMLTSVNIIASHLKTVYSYAFSGCTSLTSVSLPETVEKIDTYAFYNCYSLKDFEMPTKISEVTNYSFYNCRLVDVELSENVTKIGDYAFYNNYTIKNLTIPDSVTTINQYAFQNCYGLTDLVVPTSVTTIAQFAFSGCYGLKSLTLPFIGEALRSNSQYYRYPLGWIFGTSSYSSSYGASQTYYSTGNTSATYYIPNNLAEVTINFPEDIGAAYRYIYYGSFYNCYRIKKITINNYVTSVYDYAFYRCSALTEVNFPEDDTVTSIGVYAFDGCSALTTVTGTENLVTIGNYAFNNCSKLESITIPESVTTIGTYAFYNCQALPGALSLPKITVINDYTFYNCQKLTGVTITPASVTAIGQYAFYNCVNLETINLPTHSSFRTINNYTFAYCYKLKEISLSAYVTTIGERAFYSCYALENLTIPASVTSLGVYAFYNCYNIATIEYNARSCSNLAVNNYVFTNLGNSVTGGAKLTIGSNVTSIPEYLFHATNKITEVEFAGGSACTYVGTFAFYGCRYVEKMTIPFVGRNINNTGNPVYTFGLIFGYSTNTSSWQVNDTYWCLQYTSGSTRYWYAIPHTLKTVHVLGGNRIPYNGFMNCKDITEITIPASVSVIHEYAFQNCNALETLNYNATSVSDLGANNYTMYNVGSDYTSANTGKSFNVKIGANVTRIPAYLFNPYNYVGYAPRIKTLEFPEDSACTTIGQYAFAYCQYLKTVTIPEKVTSIGTGAFRDTGYYNETTSNNQYTLNYNATAANDLGSGNLVFYNIGTTRNESGVTVGAVTLNVGANVTKIPAYIFNPNNSSASPKFKTVNFEENSQCASIGNYAFYYCYYLEEVQIPDSVKSIGAYAFANCNKLVKADHVGEDASVETWSSIAFGNQSANPLSITANSLNTTGCRFYINGELVESLEFSEDSEITEIKPYAYYNCSFLKEITIPETVSKIGEYAFYGCSGLEEITIPELVTVINAYTFYGCTGLKSISIPDSIVVIGTYAFGNCTGLTSVVVPDSVTTIHEAAFRGCNNLTEITLPFVGYTSSASAYQAVFGYIFGSYIRTNTSGVSGAVYQYYASNQYYWYYIPSKLTKVTITDGGRTSTVLPVNAFYNCNQLSEIVIPENLTTINNYAFYNCKGISSVNLPNGVTTINEGAFSGCSGLLKFDIPTNEAYTTVSNSCFYGCSGLTEIVIPENVKTIGVNAFFGCSGLTELTIPETVTTINLGAFGGCNNLESIVVPYIGNTLKTASNASNQYPFGYIFGTTSYSGSASTSQTYITSGSSTTSTVYYIPVSLKTVTVKGGIVMYGAFMNCRYLTDITYPDTVTELGAYSFYGCSSLRGLELPENATIVNNYTFYGCKAFTSINIHEKIKTIGTYAYAGCAGLTTIVVPNSVTTINNYAFYNCTKLISITLPFVGRTAPSSSSTSNVVFESLFGYIFGGVNDTWNSRGTSYHSYSGTVQYYYYYSQQKSESVWSSYYGKYVTNYYYQYYYTRYYYQIPASLKEVIITGGSYIPRNAFYACSRLTTIVIPESVQQMGQDSLYGCSNLANITIPFIGINRNTTTGNTSTFGYPFGSGGGYLQAGTYHYIPTSIRSITVTQGNGTNYSVLADYAFRSCYYVTNITIPDTVTTIGQYAFSECRQLRSVNIPDGVKTIGQYGFYDCRSLESLVLPEGITRIENYTFNNCLKLESINIPVAVTYIGQYAFQSCRSLKSIIIPDGVSTMSYAVFDGCSSLTEINIPDAVTSIGGYAFRNCSKLTSITIPERVTSIGGYAFFNCTGLTEINYNATSCSNFGANNYVFYNCGNAADGITVTVGGTVTRMIDYMFYPENGNATATPNIKKVEFALDCVCSSIGNYTFTYCADLESVNLPDSVTSIGTCAFQYCTGLKSLCLDSEENVLPERMTSIANYAFDGCSSLESITIPEKVTTLGIYSFRNCTALRLIVYNATSCGDLTSGTDSIFYNAGAVKPSEEGENELGNAVVRIGKNVKLVPSRLFHYSHISTVTFADDSVCTGIGYYAFASCTMLESVNIPNTVNTIGKYAFYDCNSLKDINIPLGVTEIQEYTFYRCALESIIIPNTVSTIADYAFNQCKDLQSIEIPYSVTVIQPHAYQLCLSLKSIIIPENVTAMPASALYGCGKLESITIPFVGASKTATSAGSTALLGHIFGTSNYEGAESVDQYYTASAYTRYFIPSSLRNVTVTGGNILFGAFSSCAKITDITIPDGLTAIEGRVFYNCTNLLNVNIPATVTEVRADSFYKCTTGKNVYFGGTLEQWCNIVFNNEHATPLRYGGKLYINGEWLTNLTIPNRITEIHDYIFFGGLFETLTIHESVHTIGKKAFYESIIDVINFNATECVNVQDAEEAAFYNAGSVDEDGNGTAIVKITANVAFIPEYLFYHSNVKSVEFKPNSLCSYISAYAFSDCASLVRVEIPENVLTIYENAFLNCEKKTDVYYEGCLEQWCAIDLRNDYSNPLYYGGDLYLDDYAMDGSGSGKIIETLVISASMTEIEPYAFTGCTSIKYVYIPDSVTKIGRNAFADCYELLEISIPDTVTEIGEYILINCPKLEKITVEEGNPRYHSDGNCLIETETKTLIAGCRTSIIPGDGSVLTINDSAFYGSTLLETIVIPDAVKTIDVRAFYNCTGLKNLTIGKGVNSIANYAFYNCTALERIQYNAVGLIEETGKYYDLEQQNFVFYDAGKYSESESGGILVFFGPDIEKVPAHLFNPNDGDGAPNISTVEFEIGGVSDKIIGDYAFAYSHVVKVVIPDNVTEIGVGAFYECGDLNEINIPMGVEEIRKDTFYNCVSLPLITIPESVTTIGERAFYNCTALLAIDIHDKVTLIEKEAFVNSGHYLSEERWVGELYYINSYLINTRDTLKGEVEIENETTLVASYAFSGRAVTKVVVPESVNIINKYAFYNCTSLNTVNIPSAVEVISEHVFDGCTALTSITIPENVLTIEAYAFNNCTRISTINFNAINCEDLDESLPTNDGNHAFYNTGNATSGVKVIFGEQVARVPANLFHPYHSGNSPKITTVTFEGDNCSSIGAYAFAYCTSITSIEITKNVTSIGSYAFLGCTALNTLKFNAIALDDLDENSNVFDNTAISGSGLSVTFGKDVLKVPAYLFYASNSPKVTGVAFEQDSVCVAIGAYAFYGCDDFSIIKLPTYVAYVGDGAFKGCSRLAWVYLSDEAEAQPLTAAYSISEGDGETEPEHTGTIRYGENVFEGCSNSLILIAPNRVSYEHYASELSDYGSRLTYIVTVNFVVHDESNGADDIVEMSISQEKLYNYALNFVKQSNGTWATNSSYNLPTLVYFYKLKVTDWKLTLDEDAAQITRLTVVNTFDENAVVSESGDEISYYTTVYAIIVTTVAIPANQTVAAYDGEAHSYVISGIFPNSTILNSDIYEVVSLNSFVNANEEGYEISLQIKEYYWKSKYRWVGHTNDEDIDTVIVRLFIKKKIVSVASSGVVAENKTYNGNTEANLNYSVDSLSGVVERDKDILNYNAKGTFIDKSAGVNKVVYVSLALTGNEKTGDAGAENYKLSVDQFVVYASILQKTVSITWGDKEFDYDGLEHKPEAVVSSGLVGSDKCDVTVVLAAPKNAGEYTSAVTLTNPDYMLAERDRTVTFVINKVDLVIKNPIIDIKETSKLFEGEDDKLFTSSTLNGNLFIRLNDDEASEDYVPTYFYTGKFTWTDGAKKLSELVDNTKIDGSNRYLVTFDWTFELDAEFKGNFNNITFEDTTGEYCVYDVEIAVISAEQTSDKVIYTIYTVDTEDKINKLKNWFTVSATNNDGTSAGTLKAEDYDIILFVYEDDGKTGRLIEGENTLRFVYNKDLLYNGDGDVYNELTAEAELIIVKVPDNVEENYTGTEHKYVISGDFDGYTLSEDKSNAAVYEVTSDNSFKHANDYTVELTLTEAYDSKYYKWEGTDAGVRSVEITFTIKQLPVTVTNITVEKDKDYDGTDVATVYFSQAVIKGILDCDKEIVGLTATAKYDDLNAGKGRVITVTLVFATLEGYEGDADDALLVLSDYIFSSDSTTVFTGCEIRPLLVEIEWIETEFVYNRGPQKPSARVIDGLLDGESCEVLVSDDDAKTNANAEGQHYTATVTLDNSNYYLAEKDKRVDFVINRAPLDFTPSVTVNKNSKGRLYDGYSLSDVFLGLPGEDVGFSGRFSWVAGQILIIGEHEYNWTFTLDSISRANYIDFDGPQKIKLTTYLEVSAPTSQTITYDRQAHTFIIDDEFADIYEIAVTDDNDFMFTDANTDGYEIKLRIIDDEFAWSPASTEDMDETLGYAKVGEATVKLFINKATFEFEPVVKVVYDDESALAGSNTLYTSSSLDNVVLSLPESLIDGETEEFILGGTFEWVDGQKLIKGNNSYAYRFILDEDSAKNYIQPVGNMYVKLDVEEVKVASLTVKLLDEYQGSSYHKINVGGLKEWIEVTAINNDLTTEVISAYTLSRDTSNDGEDEEVDATKFKAGRSKVIVTYEYNKEIKTDFEILVTFESVKQPEDQTVTYDGTAKTLDLDMDIFVFIGDYEFTNAGEHTVTLGIKDGYDWADDVETDENGNIQVKLIIEKAEIDFTPVVIYNGEELTDDVLLYTTATLGEFTLSLPSDLIGKWDNYTLSWDELSSTNLGQGVKAYSWTFVLSGEVVENYVASELTGEIYITAYEPVYLPANQGADGKDKIIYNGEYHNFVVSEEFEEIYAVKAPEEDFDGYIDAGEYEIQLQIIGEYYAWAPTVEVDEDGYIEGLATVTLTINKFTIVVREQDFVVADKTYNGDADATDYVTNPEFVLIDDGSGIYVAITAVYNDSYRGANDAAYAGINKHITVTLDLATDNEDYDGDLYKNYVFERTEVVLDEAVIKPKQVELLWGDLTFVYDGTPKKPSATIVPESLIDGDSCNISINTGACVNASPIAYTANVTITNNNYCLAEDDAIVSFYIAKANIDFIPTVTYVDCTKLYYGLHSLDNVVLGLPDNCGFTGTFSWVQYEIDEGVFEDAQLEVGKRNYQWVFTLSEESAVNYFGFSTDQYVELITYMAVDSPVNQGDGTDGNSKLVYDADAHAYVLGSNLFEFADSSYSFTNANEDGYDIRIKLSNSAVSQYYTWADGIEADKDGAVTVKLFIYKATADVDVSYTINTSDGILYASGDLYKDAELSYTSGIEGKVVWTEKQTLIAGDSEYEWTFKPDNANYNEVKGNITLAVVAVQIASLEVDVISNSTIYTYYAVDKLADWIKVIAINNDGTVYGTIDEFSLKGSCEDDEQRLIKGDNTITVIYSEDVYTTFKVNVKGTELEIPEDQTVSYDGKAHSYVLDGSEVYYVVDPLTNSYTDVNEDGYEIVIKIKSDYIDDYEWIDGSETVTVRLIIEKGDPVIEPTVTITGTVNNLLYVSSDLYTNAIISFTDIEGTIKWNDGQTLTAGTASYEWTFTPSGDDAAKYNEVSGTYELTVEELKIVEIEVDVISVAEIYATYKVSRLSDWISVTGLYNDGTSAGEVTDYKLTGSVDGDENKLEEGLNTITVTYDEGVTATFTVNVLPEDEDPDPDDPDPDKPPVDPDPDNPDKPPVDPDPEKPPVNPDDPEKIIAVAVPKDQQYAYDGKAHSYLIDHKKYSIIGTGTYTNANEDGYEITLGIKAGYKWADVGDDVKEVTVKLIITKLPVSVSGLTAGSKIYDGTVAAGKIDCSKAVISGLLANDAVGVEVVSAEYNDKNVGKDKVITALIKLNGDDAANYRLVNDTVEINGCEIAPMQLSLVWGETSFPYDGTEKKPYATISKGLVSGDACDVYVNVPVTCIYASEWAYTANVSLSNANYCLAEEDSTVEFYITKAKLEFVPDYRLVGTKALYTTCTLDNVVLSVPDGVGCAGTFEWGKGQQLKAGEYEYSWSFTLAEEYTVNYEVADLTTTIKLKVYTAVSLPDNQQADYDGQEHGYVVAEGAVYSVSGDNTFIKANEDGYEIKLAITSEFFAWAQNVKEDENGCATVKFIINKKTLTVSANGLTVAEKTYDGTVDASIDCAEDSLVGVVSGDELVLTATGVYTDCNAENGKKVTVQLTLSGKDAENYKLASDTTEIKGDILPKSVTLDWQNTEFTYDGTAKLPEATANGLIDGDECLVTVSTETECINASATPYTAIASLENSNYYLEDSELSGLFVINKAVPEINPVVVITGTEGNALYPSSDLYTNALIMLSKDCLISGEVEWTDGQVLVEGINVYSWKFTPKGDSAINYTGTEGYMSLTVNKIVLAGIRVEVVSDEPIYESNNVDDLRDWIKVIGINNDGSVYGEIKNYQLSGNGESSKLSEGINYINVLSIPTMFEANFEINCLKDLIPIEIPDDQVYNYNGQAHGFDLYGLAGSNRYEVVGNNSFVNANESGYSVTLRIKEGYKWEGRDNLVKDVTVKVIILKATPVIRPSYEITGTVDNLLYTSSNLIDNVLLTLPDGITGSVRWASGQALKEGYNEYEWIFVPTGEDAVNYTECSGTIALTVKPVEIVSITADVISDETVYSEYTVDQLKSWLKVTGTNNDGTSAGTVNIYDLIGSADIGTDKLELGTNTILVRYNNNVTTSFEINAEEFIKSTGITSGAIISAATIGSIMLLALLALLVAYVLIKRNAGFHEKLIHSDFITQKLCRDIEEEFLSCENVDSRVSVPHMSFFMGDVTVAYLLFKGKELCLALALDPKSYEGTKYASKAISDYGNYRGMPMVMSLLDEGDVKIMKKFIDDMVNYFNTKGVKKSRSSEPVTDAKNSGGDEPATEANGGENFFS